MAVAAAADRAELEKAAAAFSAVQRARILNRHGASYERMLRARDRWDPRWEASLGAVWPRPDGRIVNDLATAGARAWAAEANTDGADVQKAIRPLRVLNAIGSAVRAILASPFEFVNGALAVYMSLATDTSEEAGQHSLDQLGLNETFRWTSVRDMPRDIFSVRGSKIIQHAYGNHIDRLRDIVIDATDPARPKTQAEVRRQISEEWSALNRSQVARIARTEVAAVWNTASVNAYAANEVAWYDWSVATGPSVGPPKSEDVCPTCLRRAAGNPYPLQELPDLPAHPNCRCVIIPSLERDWLPPAEPWHGNNPPLPLVEAPVP